MVNFMCHLTGPKDTQIVDKTWFQSVAVRVPLGEIRGLGDWESGSPLPVGLAIMDTAMRYSEDKYVLCLCWAVHLLLTLDVCSPGSLALVSDWCQYCWLTWFSSLQVRTGTIPLAFQCIQLTVGRWWDFCLQSCEPIPHHKYLSIYSICVNPLDSVSLENSK